MNMMRKTINKSLPYIVGIIIGIVSFLPFTRPTSTAAFLTGFGKDAINQWNYYLDYGLESQNIWQRAYVSLLGLLPSASPEVIYLQTSFDDGESHCLVIAATHYQEKFLMHVTGVMQFMEMITIIYKILIAYLMNQLLMICLLKLQMEASLHR